MSPSRGGEMAAFERPGRIQRHGCAWPAMGQVLLVSLICGLAGAAEVRLEDLSNAQLIEVLSLELMQQDQKAPEELYHLNEFQEVSELDCGMRLFYLMNQTVTVRDAVAKLHEDVLGLSGLFVQLMRRAPEESTWVWLVATSQERALQKVQSYYFRVMALAVDQHPCLKAVVRDAVLHGVEGWKQLQVDLLALQWHSFAFGMYKEPGLEDEPGPGKAAVAASKSEESFLASSFWLAKLRTWLEGHTEDLYQAMLALEGQEVSGAGPIRLHHQDEHGSFVTYEFLRRKVFKQWAIDKGLVR
ncbi:unnamed protein product, partial [Effrenium voratum]